MNPRFLFVISILTLTLGGCGQKGDLYLPKQDAAAQTSSAEYSAANRHK